MTWDSRIVRSGEENPHQLLAEEWLPVVGYEGLYEVSDQGRVRRLPGGRGVRSAGRILRLANHNAGYQSVGLWAHNKARVELVHRVVATAFLGPANGREVNHRNLNKHDNRLANLEWVTRSENQLHRAAHGIGRGEANGAAKITEKDVQRIRSLHREGLGYKRIAKATGITWGIVRAVCTGRIWSWLPEEA